MENDMINISSRERKNVTVSLKLADDSLSDLVNTMKELGLYDNSIIIVASDNGGKPTTGYYYFSIITKGSLNVPYRGWKNTLWEGGYKVGAFIHSPLIPSSSYGLK